jgi:hypothetical protein
MSAARFRLTARVSRPVLHAAPIPSGRVESTRRRWPPVVSAHVGWPLLSTAPDVIRRSHRPLHFSPPPFDRTPHCCALRWPLLHPPLLIADEPPRAVRPGQKVHLVPAPLLCQEPPPRRRLAKPGHRISSPSSSSVSASPATAHSNHSPTLPIPQQAPCCQGAPPRPLPRPPRPLLRPLTSVSSRQCARHWESAPSR